MTDLSKIARPYASAVFAIAKQEGALQAWSGSLQALSLIASDPVAVSLMKNPKFSKENLVELFLSIGAEDLVESAKKLVQVLARFKRLSCLPDIARLYEEYRARAEQVIKVELVSAKPLAESYQQLIAEKLSQRHQCQVEVATEIDPTLLGGAIVRTGDYVIDGSVKGRLQTLKESIVL
jgi:F-type H+-transporting ATPase subunit delta